ncbi:TPA: hypothetical protein NKP06_004583 [Vibrio parahaemolyticus]|nr:hypothetical protein [Vibrio parahaemolyticus]HCH0825168.1 hypothetical protein [Vibrio parahaemolyticus]
MNFNFQESLAKGQESASLVMKNQSEVEDVYNELTKALTEHLGFEVHLYDRKEYKGVDSQNSLLALGAVINAWATPERVATGYNILSLGIDVSDIPNVDIFKYKESDDVYPITVLFNRDKVICYNQDEFATAINKALENSRLNLELIDFKHRVDEHLKSASESDEID